MKEKPFSEMVNGSIMKRIKAKETFVRALYVEMQLTEIQLNNRKEQLLVKIDQAIDERNRPLFMTLTDELKALNKQYGT